MATRRVKRIRRTKKQVHRAHGRKTKHHHKRNHNDRHTRRHQGGMQAIIGAVKLFKGSKLNEKGTTESPTPFDGIEVNYFKKYDTFHLGNGRYTLNDYLSDRSKMDYGEKIQTALNRTNANIRALSMINQEQVGGTISLEKMNELELTPGQFVYFAAATNSDQRRQELFDRLYPAEAKPAAAAAPPEPEPTFALENGPIGSRKMLLYFKGTPMEFEMGKPLVINVPVGPKSPISKLIFFGNDNEITIEYVLKPDAMSYCAMARYDAVNQFAPTRDGELNHEFPPSITKKLHLLKKGKKEELDTQIRTMIAKIESYANDCAAEKDVMDNGHAYYTDVRSAHVPDPIRHRILGLFGRPSSPVVDDLAVQMSGLTPMGGVARPPSSSSGI